MNSKNKKTILITGSSGMIGTALCIKLLREGHTIIPVDKRPNEFSEVINDLTVLHDLTEPLNDSYKPDIVIHLAANARVYNLVINPDLALENILTTYHSLEFCRKHNIKEFYFASSRETYGNHQELPVKEEGANQRNSESAYTASKISGEALCYAYRECYGTDAIIMRFSNVYGKYDNSDRFVPLAIERMKDDEEFKIFGEEKSLDFTYIDDCISGILCLLKSKKKDIEYNISSGEEVKLVDTAEQIKELLNSDSEIILDKTRIGEVTNYYGDITRMRSLGWSPKISLNEGLKLSVDYYLN